MKLIEKHKINFKYYKTYNTPKTPYHRMLDHPSTSPEMKQHLTDTYKQLNPFALKKIIAKKLDNFFRLLK
jgi:hypothetical protein